MKPAVRQTGIALVLVLWVLVLLTTMAGSVVLLGRGETELARNQVQGVRFRAHAAAGLTQAVLRLRARDEEARWYPDGTAYGWRFDGEALEIRIRNAGSLVELNAAGEPRLLALLKAAGLEEERASALAQAILDWRDADHDRRADGAEDDDYRAAGYPYGAADRPFPALEELLQVQGMDRALYGVLAPNLSAVAVGSGSPRLAPPLVRAAMAEEGRGPVGDAGPPPRGGPFYRIRVKGQDGRSMEALIMVSNTLLVIWRRYAW